MKKPQQSSHGEARQIGRFGLVGVLNTMVDFVVLNLLLVTFLNSTQIYFNVSGFAVTGTILASVIAGTVAMINSYVFNQRFTFKSKHVSTDRAMYFFIITMFGLYVIRPLVIKLFTETWLWPADTAYLISNYLHLTFSRQFEINNIALAAAIAIVLVYNYVLYKKIVFVSHAN